jgi:hypothetical protein
VDVVVDDVSPLDADLSYLEHPVKILDRQDRVNNLILQSLVGPPIWARGHMGNRGISSF